MAIRKVKTRIEQIATRKAGVRVKLFKNSWFTWRGDLEVEVGRVYSMVVNDTTGIITEIRELSSERDIEALEILQEREIDRLQAVVDVQRDYIVQEGNLAEFDVHMATQAGKGRISLDSFLNEIDRVNSIMSGKQGEREVRAGMNSECKNPGLAVIIRNKHTMPDGSISAGKTELYDSLHEGYRDSESYHQA